MTPEQAERIAQALERMAAAAERHAACAIEVAEQGRDIARAIGVERAPVTPIREADSTRRG